MYGQRRSERQNHPSSHSTRHNHPSSHKNTMDAHRRAGLQRHDRPTVVRRYCHQTRLGNRCNRWSLRALQRACARSCSISPKMRCSPCTIMGGAVYPGALSRRDLRGRGVAQGRPTGRATVEGSEITTCFGRPASLACSGDLQLIRWRGARDHLLALSRPSRRAAVGWKVHVL